MCGTQQAGRGGSSIGGPPAHLLLGHLPPLGGDGGKAAAAASPHHPHEAPALALVLSNAGLFGARGPAIAQRAVEEEAVDTLFEFGGQGRTLAMIAAYHGCLDVLELLLEAGADPNLAAPGDGASALHCAADGCSPTCLATIQLLLSRGADANQTDAAGR